MRLSNSFSRFSRRAASGPKASQSVRSGIARPQRRRWPHDRLRIGTTALRSAASRSSRWMLRPPGACSRFRARAEYEVRNDEKGTGPAPRSSSLPRAQSDREVPPRSCRATPAARKSAVVAAASNKRSIAAWSRSISGTPRRGADGITNPPPGWGPGEQTTLARRIFSGGRAVDGDEDEPTPKLMITETGGLSLISLKHVASRGPAGLPTSAFGPPDFATQKPRCAP